MVDTLLDLFNDRVRELEAGVGFKPYSTVEDINLDFVSNKNDYTESDLQAVKYTKIMDKNNTYKLEIHESYSKVSEPLMEREAIRSFIHPNISTNPIVSYFIHATISSSEYLWTKMLEQLRERYIEYTKQYSELKIGIIRKETAISFEKTQILRLLHELNITTPKSLIQLFFWRNMFLITGIESLEFQEAAIFKQLLTYMTPKQFGYGVKQIKDEMFESQEIIKIPKKSFEEAFGSLVEKLDLRRCLSLNWAITHMCRYLVLIELVPSFVETRAEFFDYFIKPIRLLATCCISRHTLCIIYADSRDLEKSYLKYLEMLKNKKLILNFEAFVVDSYENSINLNYFNHPNLPPLTVLTDDIIQSAAFQSEYAHYAQYITPNHRNTKKEDIQTVIKYLQHTQIQTDYFYPDISFRKFLEQLSLADVCILFLCIINHTIRPFSMYPVDKQALEMLQAGISDTVRIYKRLDTRKQDLNRYLDAFPSLRGALIEVLNTHLGMLKQDIAAFFETEFKKTGRTTFSIEILATWLENLRSTYRAFMQEHPDIIERIFDKIVEMLSQKRSDAGQKELSISKRFEKMFDNEFGELLKWLTQLNRTGISILYSQLVDSVAKRIPTLQKVSEDLKAYLGLEKPRFEQKISELVQYAGEMRTVEMNLFRSTLYARDAFYLVLNVPHSDSRIQDIKQNFFYSIISPLRTIYYESKENSKFTYLRIQTHPGVINELRRRLYASFSSLELLFLGDSSSPHLLYSLTSTDLLMKLSNPFGDFDSCTEFATRERMWPNHSEDNNWRELSKAQKEKVMELQKSIDKQHELLLKKREVKDLLTTTYTIPEAIKNIPKELIKIIKNAKFIENINEFTLKGFRTVLKDITLNIIPSSFALQKGILIIRSKTIDLYPDRICRSSLGILFGPGLHSLRFGNSGSEHWLILQYYIPLNFETSSQGFKKVLETLEEVPDLSYDFLRVEAEAVYYNFDLYLNGNWLNLDFVLESKFRLSDRDFEYLKPHLKNGYLNAPPQQPSTAEARDLLIEFQNADFDRKIAMLPQISSLSTNYAVIDFELIPESFDFHNCFAILAFSSDSVVLEKVKILLISIPKSTQLTVTRLQSSSSRTKSKTGVFIIVHCGTYSMRYSIFGLYSHLKKLGCESVDIFTGLADPMITERSILFFKQKSWTAWILSSSTIISFFPLIGRYSFSLDSEDLMNLYSIADRMQIFTDSEYELHMKRLRHAFTELKKSGEKISVKAIQLMMEKLAGQNIEDNE